MYLWIRFLQPIWCEMQYFLRFLPFYLPTSAWHTSYLLTFLPLLHSRWRILLPITYTHLIHDRSKLQTLTQYLTGILATFMYFQWNLVPDSDTHTMCAPHLLKFLNSTTTPHQDTPFHFFNYLLSLYYLYYLYLSYLFSKMKVTTFKFYDDYLNEDLSMLNDDETVEASNQLSSSTLVLQIKASNNSKLADAKTTLKAPLELLSPSFHGIPILPSMTQREVLKLSHPKKNSNT